MITTLLVVVTVFGAARVTHLFADDTLLAPWRAWVERHSAWWGEAVACTYCVSVWVAGVATLWLLWRLPGIPWDLALAMWPAMSALIIAWEALVERLWP
jgi:hypothetical protein